MGKNCVTETLGNRYIKVNIKTLGGSLFKNIVKSLYVGR
jgi:hypothetical protein